MCMEQRGRISYDTAMLERVGYNPEETEQSLERSIEAHYRSLVPAMTETGLIHFLPEKEAMGAAITDGSQIWECPMPTLERVQQVIERETFTKEKYEQGFTLLHMVPLLTQGELITTLGTQLKKHKAEGKLFGPDGTPLELDINQSVYLYDQFKDADINGSMRYHHERFDRSNPGGMTKAELIKKSLTTPFPGWEVSLIEPGEMAAKGSGKTIKGRKQLEAGTSSKDSLNLIQTDPMYRHESGKIPESWLAEFLIRLHTKNQVLGDYSGIGKAEFLIGAYYPSSDRVPRGLWSRDYRQAYLDASNPDFAYDYDGVRSVVRIGGGEK